MTRIHSAMSVAPLLFLVACAAVDDDAQESTSETADFLSNCDPASGPTTPPREPSRCQGTAGGTPTSFSPPACEVFAGPHRGLAICGTLIQDLRRTNGLHEIFVIGTNFAVWHAWQTTASNWAPWQTLGGQVFCRDFPPCSTFDGVAMPVVSNSPVISVHGTDGRKYCRAWPWSSNWGLC